MPLAAGIDKGRYAASDRVKGKQVQVLCDLVTVIRECGFDDVTDAYVLGRQNSHDDLSARKPASCLVQGIRYFRNSQITSNWSYCDMHLCRKTDFFCMDIITPLKSFKRSFRFS